MKIKSIPMQDTEIRPIKNKMDQIVAETCTNFKQQKPV